MIDEETRSRETILKLLSGASIRHAAIAKDWNTAMFQGSICYEKPIGFNTRRLYLNSANKFWQYLDADYKNLYKATVKAIEDCRPDQYSSRKHIKEAAISLYKFLVHNNLLIEEGCNEND